MLDRVLNHGMIASYVLMDSWFTHAPLIQEVLHRGLTQALPRIWTKTVPSRALLRSQVQGKKKNILRSFHAELAPGIPVLVFVRHRTNKKEWLLSFQLTLHLALKM